MTFLSVHQEGTWREFFGDTSYISLFRENGVGPFSQGNANSFFIRRCIYVDLHPQGGIRFLSTTENMRIFINDTTFRSCFTDYQRQSGGSFYWREQGSCVQCRNCYDTSWCSNTGQAYGTTVSSNGINHCNFSTLNNLGIDENLYQFSVGQSGGNVFINNNNQTFCKCNIVAGISSSKFAIFYQKFSNYRSILTGGGHSFVNSNNANPSYFQNINSINNTTPSAIYLNTQFDGTTAFENCTFKDNTCMYIIQCDVIQILISNMFVENISQISGDVIFSNTLIIENIENVILS